ncbi:ATP-binding protein [Desulfurivibrio sp. D14AmB]|uniref:ATP-binding protein n=1 Tax=Desulfurivibrio sp. D14AmB TaxID=3374370 RepID=UPI00376EF970
MDYLNPINALRYFSVAGRYLAYGLVIGLLANLSALIGLVLHPEISYFDSVHVIVGVVFALLSALLCGFLESQINEQKAATQSHARPVFFSLIVVFIWTVLIGGSLLWFKDKERQRIHTVAMSEASTIFDKDLLYYRWAANQEGVFVPVTETSRPNPILEHLVPDSTVITDTGRVLTLVNPEYMIRQVYDMQTGTGGPRGHITSLDPLWAGNTADAWEREVLEEFERGDRREAWIVEEIDGEPFFRLMRPMVTEDGCLRCHAGQGYIAGDIRGGISVSVPIALLHNLYRESLTVVAIVHWALWLLGLLGIFLGSYRITSSIREKEQAEARLQAIIDHMRDGLVIMDEAGVIESVNTPTENMFGYSAAEITGRRIDFLIRFPAATDPDQLVDALGEAMNSNRPLNGQRRDDSFFPLAFSLSQMQHGSKLQFILILRDITDEEQHRSEAVRAGQFAALGELAAGVAHEINNPINGIINYSQILLDEIDPEVESTEREILPRIIKESERVAAIVKNLLSFARQRDEIVEDLSIQEVIDDCISLLLYQFEKDGIRVEVEIPDDLPPLRGNPQHLHQVFLNLLSNARYALNVRYQERHPDKRIKIASRLVTIQERSFIRTTITDYGIGIDQDTIDHVFDALFTTKPPGEGTGLGLGISKGLVRDHNGQLYLESVPGQYTTATVDLPANPHPTELT